MKNKLSNPSPFSGVSALIHDKNPTLFFKSQDTETISTAQSIDGFEFEKTEDLVMITDLNGQIVQSSQITNTRISPLFKDYLMFYQLKEEQRIKTYIARSNDLLNWFTYQKSDNNTDLGLTVDNYVYKDRHVFYFGGKNFKVGFTSDGNQWDFEELNVVDAENIEIDFTLKTSQGIFVLFHHYSHISNNRRLEIKAVCFDKDNPTKTIWQTNASLWEEPASWLGTNPNCLGCFIFHGKILSYWNIPGTGIYTVTYPFYGETPTHEHKHYIIPKHDKNPILRPDPRHEWENEAVFNAAAFEAEGKVYLVYRAVGYGYISVLGYAESQDGVNFEKRLAEPIFSGNNDFDTKQDKATFESVRQYISGGGYGGCEDPRITRIGNRLYLIYVAFNGFDPPRLALTSILYKDFINHRFLWEKPVLISPPGIVDKSGCVLPEKINGKYVIFHRVYPNILIDYLDDLNFDGTKWLKGEFKITPRPTMWDSRKVGIGAPPIKTKDGWLLIYQGVNDKDDSKYRIGAMILDLKDPTKVLYRTNHPIIEPTEYYENHLAKFGIVYPCGAVIKDGTLLIYYGGSDSVTCVASANLEEFLEQVKNGTDAQLSPIKLND